MSRKTLQDDEKNAVCVRYAQTGSLRAVASEYGISPMRVKRLWEALGEQQQQVLRASVEDLRQEVEGCGYCRIMGASVGREAAQGHVR